MTVTNYAEILDTLHAAIGKMKKIPMKDLSEKEKADVAKYIAIPFATFEAGSKIADEAWTEGTISYATFEAIEANLKTKFLDKKFWFSNSNWSLFWFADKIIDDAGSYAFRDLRNSAIFEAIQEGESVEDLATELGLDVPTVEYYARRGGIIFNRYKESTESEVTTTRFN